MTLSEALDTAAEAHKNLHERLENIDIREISLDWSQEHCKEQRNLAFEQYTHTLDLIMFERKLAKLVS